MTQRPEDISQADELDELERLLAEATPGEWKFSPWHVEEGEAAVRAPEGWIIANTSSDANAALMVAAVNALPKLIAAARLAHTPAGVPREATAEMVAYALEAADEMEQLSNDARKMAGAVLEIVNPERVITKQLLYNSEADRWLRLAKAVRSLAAPETIAAFQGIADELRVLAASTGAVGGGE